MLEPLENGHNKNQLWKRGHRIFTFLDSQLCHQKMAEMYSFLIQNWSYLPP